MIIFSASGPLKLGQNMVKEIKCSLNFFSRLTGLRAKKIRMDFCHYFTPYSTALCVYIVPPCCIRIHTYTQRIRYPVQLLWICCHNRSTTATLELHTGIMSAPLYDVYINIHNVTQIRCGYVFTIYTISALYTYIRNTVYTQCIYKVNHIFVLTIYSYIYLIL